MAINNLMMDFRDQFDDNSHVYMEATESTKIEYPKLAEFLAKW